MTVATSMSQREALTPITALGSGPVMCAAHRDRGSVFGITYQWDGWDLKDTNGLDATRPTRRLGRIST